MNRKRILFVDDEPNVIEGLKRMLRTYRFQWDMEFAHTGAEALAKMAELPFDVVVSDVQIPGMNGAELLERVAAGYPNTARIVLSGDAHEATSRQVAQVAHQYVSKPTTAEALIAALKRACEIQKSAGMDAMRATLAGCGSLPSLPTLYVEIVQASRSENTDAARIAKIISRDMAMSAKILQLVNSSFFGLGRRVSSIEYAVTLLGIVRVKALVLSEHIFKGFRPATRCPWLNVDELWQHSAAVAEVARRISRAEKQEGDRPDQAFTAGLLHDVGLLLLASHMPDRFEAAMEAAQTDPLPLHQIETEVLGASHAEMGGYLLGLWGLPPADRRGRQPPSHPRPSDLRRIVRRDVRACGRRTRRGRVLAWAGRGQARRGVPRGPGVSRPHRAEPTPGGVAGACRRGLPGWRGRWPGMTRRWTRSAAESCASMTSPTSWRHCTASCASGLTS